MGIYLPNMEMPTSCGVCPFHKPYYHTQYCEITGKNCSPHQTIKDWCPLAPVPPHGRLIDADALLNKNYHVYVGTSAVGRRHLNERDVANAPTIIEAEEGETE